MRGSEEATTVTLMDGRVVSIEAYLLALRLEQEGFLLRADDHGLLVAPHGQLTESHRSSIRRLKGDLLAIAEYVAGVM